MNGRKDRSARRAPKLLFARAGNRRRVPRAFSLPPLLFPRALRLPATQNARGASDAGLRRSVPVTLLVVRGSRRAFAIRGRGVAFARREEQVGLEAVLLGVQIEIASARREERFVISPLNDPPA